MPSKSTRWYLPVKYASSPSDSLGASQKSDSPWIMSVGVDNTPTSWSFRWSESYRESQASPLSQRDRYAFAVMLTQSGLEKLSAVFENSVSSSQPVGLQVPHCIRANPTGSSWTFASPPSIHKNHWYQKRLA